MRPGHRSRSTAGTPGREEVQTGMPEEGPRLSPVGTALRGDTHGFPGEPLYGEVQLQVPTNGEGWTTEYKISPRD